MPQSTIELQITIIASAPVVWRVFTDPALTMKLGGDYVTDWKVGSSIGWRTLEDGVLNTRGEILAIEPGKLLKHTLFTTLEPKAGEPSAVHSTLTYTLRQMGAKTILTAREEFEQALTHAELADAEKGWQGALQTLKMLAETV